MTESNKGRSVYFRTIIYLVLATIFIFGLLCAIYFQQTSQSIVSERSEALYRSAKSASEGYRLISEKINDQNQIETLTETFVSAIAETTSSYVWYVDPDGKISFSSDIPSQAILHLSRLESFYYMTDIQKRGLTDQPNGGAILGSQNGLLTDPHNVWISAAYPLDQSGRYIVFHQAIDLEEETFMMLIKALALPVLISFAVALLLFTLMTRSMMRPIRLLSDVARKVKNGDLSARIDLPEHETESPIQYAISDELTIMVTAVNEMIDRLERQESDRRVFVSSIAHDLRTPLTSIKGFLSAMLDGTIPPEQFEHYLQITKTEVDRIQSLTSTMTEATSLAKIDRLKITSFDINELIHDSLVSLEGFLREKKLGVQLEEDKNTKDALFVEADREAIARVVHNLLINAAKFTQEKGDLYLSTKYLPKTNKVLVTVEDSGLGIPKDKRNRIFESFYKIDASRTNQGSGLGLFICKEILRAHGQIIEVDESPTLGGARFTFTLDEGYLQEKQT